jgi:Ankyrin repeats (3 copies)
LVALRCLSFPSVPPPTKKDSLSRHFLLRTAMSHPSPFQQQRRGPDRLPHSEETDGDDDESRRNSNNMIQDAKDGEQVRRDGGAARGSVPLSPLAASLSSSASYPLPESDGGSLAVEAEETTTTKGREQRRAYYHDDRCRRSSSSFTCGGDRRQQFARASCDPYGDEEVNRRPLVLPSRFTSEATTRSRCVPSSSPPVQPSSYRDDDDDDDGDDPHEAASSSSSCLLSCPSDALDGVLEYLDLDDGLAGLSEATRLVNAACRSFLYRRLLQAQQQMQKQQDESPSSSPSFEPTSLARLSPCVEHVKDLARFNAGAAASILRDEFFGEGAAGCGAHDWDDPGDRLRSAYRQARESVQFRMREALGHVRAACAYSSSSASDEDAAASASYLTKKQGAAIMGTMAVMAMAAAAASSPACSLDYSSGTDTVMMLAASASSSCPFPTLEQVEEVAARLFKLGVMGTLMKGAAREAAKRTGRHADDVRLQQQPEEATGCSLDVASETFTSDPVTDAAPTPPHPPCYMVGEAAANLSTDDAGGLSQQQQLQQQQPQEQEQRVVRGCVGAYRRVLARSRDALRALVKQARKDRHDSIESTEERMDVAAQFMEACRRDDAEALKDLIHRVDVEGFYVSNDGTTTCGLHAAAFHNSCRVAEFLVTQGCCDVNLQDDNGWTALHFAAGASAVNAAQLLLRHDANDSLEASNGYTPLQWAVRLQNMQVVPLLLQAREETRRRWRQHHNHHHLFDALPNLVEFVANHGPPAGAMARFVLSTILPEHA